MSKKFNPEMLIIARESRGLTQSKLSRLLSVSQGKISKIESGLLGVTHDMLENLSDKLDYPEKFFYAEEQVYGCGVSMIYHRKRQSLSSSKLGMIHAETNIRRIHLARLLRSIEISENKFRYLDSDEYDGNVEQIARIVRGMWLIPKGPVKNLTKSIEDAGGIVIRCDFGTALVDGLSQWVQGLPPIFFINNRLLGDRLRYTLAHELGHIIMHKTPNPNMEDEANRFASELLMPREDISSNLNSISLKKLASLKPYWKVSMSSLLMRAFALGKISERNYRYLWMKMGKAGYRTKEPAELEIPIEEPTLFRDILSSHLNELNYSTSDLSSLLDMKEHELRSKYLGKAPKLSLVN